MCMRESMEYDINMFPANYVKKNQLSTNLSIIQCFSYTQASRSDIKSLVCNGSLLYIYIALLHYLHFLKCLKIHQLPV